ncbi:hypothetical protein [Sphingomonas sp. GB1N7]|uniref:hypothetical protein n=1 Tax=Parasphingomonas caseinilytica TaxID=3096158 RepID=UPI002FC8DAEF
MTSINFPKYGTITVSLDLVADLRTFDPTRITNGLHAIVRGQTVSTDGLGGIFTFDSTSTATDDGINTVAVNGLTTGRWTKTVRSITGAPGQKGDKGEKGETGDISPALLTARNEAVASAGAAHTSELNASGSATAAQNAAGNLTSIVGTISSVTTPGALFEFTDRLRRRVAVIDTVGTFTSAAIKAMGSYFVGSSGRRISDNPDPQSALTVIGQNRREIMDVRSTGARIGKAYVRDLTAGTIGGRPASAVVAFFGNGGVQRSDIGLLVNSTFGQSLSIGTNSSNDNEDFKLLSPTDYYHDLMFAGGVRYQDNGNNVSSLIPYAAQRPTGGAGETIHGGYNAMMAQLFNAYGIPPLDNPMSTISMAPGQGETAIDGFLEGTGLFDRFILGIQAAVNLRAGRKVVVAPVKWMQVESQGPNDDQYATKLIALANSVDTRVRAITGQTEPVGLLTYQARFGDSSLKFSTAARQSPLIQIAGPIWDLKVAGLSGSQFDMVHLANQGYYMYGARCAVADFSTIFLKRPWRPLQIARDARGRVRCRRESANRLIVKYDVPFDGELYMDQSNIRFNTTGVASAGILQNGFFVTDANDVNIPLGDVTVISRNEILIIGPNIAVAGNKLNVGSKLLNRSSEAVCALRDRMGDIITIDDFKNEPLHNPAIGEAWTMTSEELGL